MTFNAPRRLLIALGLSLGAAACSNPPSSSCNESDCEVPAPYCSDDGVTLVTSFAPRCDDGSCAFTETTEVCETGCADGACRDRCADVTCLEPAPATCSGNTLVARVLPGTPNPQTCACEYETARSACGDDVCFGGECRPFECAFLTCDSPPDPRCDGATLQEFGLGQCDPDARECVYDPIETDCAATGQTCRNGACVDGCRDEDCTRPPAPSCDGSVLLSYSATGQCADGTCDYGEPTSRDCALESAACIEGACVPLCRDEDCIAPPSPSCAANVAVQYADVGACADGACAYDQLRQDCTLEGQQCVRGRCVTDVTCEGVVCSTPPAGFCEDEVAVQYADAGFCTPGAICNYAESRRDCALAGEVCDLGVCVPFCDVAICVEPPLDFCEGDIAVIHPGFGSCNASARSCEYDPFRVNCQALGQRCFEGACVSGCVAADCNTPPTEQFCVGQEVVDWEPLGYCDAEDECIYDPLTVRDCSDTGEGCFEGQCLPYCGSALCTAPPAATCDGDVRVGSEPIGECRAGTCAYTPLRENCRADGRACLDGECVDLCETLSCTTRPDDYCDGDTLVISTFPATCEDSECRFRETRLDCRATGDICVAGACVDPCAGIICNRPPADGCDGTSIVDYRPNGICRFGTCDYTADRFDCSLIGGDCVAARCVDLCLGVVCDDVPADGCYGSELIDYSGESTCFGGDCFYFATSAIDCADFGFSCEVDVCVDPCDGVVCTSPAAPSCVEDVSVFEAGPGACDEGTCSYEQVNADCQVLGEVCVSGACDDGCGGACGGLVERECRGPIAVHYTASAPTCYDGICHRDASETDCRVTGQGCLDGVCVDVADPCDGVTCPAEGPLCEGDTVVERVAAGACVAGPPTRCDYGAAESRVNCAAGFGCWDGSCARVPQPGELVITEIAYDLVGTDLDREWIELHNVSTEPLLLAGSSIWTSNGTATLDETMLVAPGEYVVVGSSAAVAAVDFTYPYFAAPMRDDRDTIEVRRGAFVIDRVSFDETRGWPDNGGRPIQLAPAVTTAAGNDAASAWCRAPADGGSPGAANPACSP
ncbi:MAG: lamin tail domain-containing protein [Myxococcales bacterium]|nr:lamin tail domain-containing protein [Myxococcales bacterium]MCB9533458.1 lamin tail domain-containing protein [Myxococcales bacterium]